MRTRTALVVAAFLVVVSAAAVADGALGPPVDTGPAVDVPDDAPLPPPDMETMPYGPGPDGTRHADQLAPPLFSPTQVDLDVEGFYSWSLLDRRTGEIAGSANHGEARTTTESMIKPWIAADYLRRLGEQQPSAGRLAALTRMIRDSDDAATEDVYWAVGGDATVERLIGACDLTDTSVVDSRWSLTRMSARDAARMGLCLADGRAAGAQRWTDWILNEMRFVRGEGRFGIVEALPEEIAGSAAIKNGWTLWYGDREWHVNCLAVVEDHVLAVLTRYPSGRGLGYGAGICRGVTEKLLYTPE